MLLVDEVKSELVLVGADLMADAALPRARQSVKRGVQEVHAALEEQYVTVLALEEPSLADVVREDVVEGGEPSDRQVVLTRLVLRLAHRVRDRRQLGCRSLHRRVDRHAGEGGGRGGRGGGGRVGSGRGRWRLKHRE